MAEEASAAIEAGWAKAAAATYEVRAAKRYALAGVFAPASVEPDEEESGPIPGSDDEAGGHGADWGAVIHMLLHRAIENPQADLLATARSVLPEYDLDAGLAEAAVETVRRVAASEMWKRAMRAQRCLSEVPFEVLVEETPNQVVLGGIMDLVFEEPDGWVLVDYKTDSLRGGRVEGLVEKYALQVRLYADAWQRCTGHAVKEAALYFVRGDLLVPVSPNAAA
jgi:ATP-dependent helicase/nuclease subunit A